MIPRYLEFLRKRTESKSEGVTLYTDELTDNFDGYHYEGTVILLMPAPDGTLYKVRFHPSRNGQTLYTAKKNWPFKLPTTDVADGKLLLPVLGIEN